MRRTDLVNVSVPHDVRARMRGRPDVNWSAVAAAAFKAVLDGCETAVELAAARAEVARLRDALEAVRRAAVV